MPWSGPRGALGLALGVERLGDRQGLRVRLDDAAQLRSLPVEGRDAARGRPRSGAGRSARREAILFWRSATVASSNSNEGTTTGDGAAARLRCAVARPHERRHTGRPSRTPRSSAVFIAPPPRSPGPAGPGSPRPRRPSATPGDGRPSPRPAASPSARSGPRPTSRDSRRTTPPWVKRRWRPAASPSTKDEDPRAQLVEALPSRGQEALEAGEALLHAGVERLPGQALELAEAHLAKPPVRRWARPRRAAPWRAPGGGRTTRRRRTARPRAGAAAPRPGSRRARSAARPPTRPACARGSPASRRAARARARDAGSRVMRRVYRSAEAGKGRGRSPVAIRPR